MRNPLENLHVVIPDFIDLDDEKYKYDLLEAYPREGYEPSPERVQELATGENAANKVIVAKYLTVDDFEVEEGEADYSTLKKDELKDLLDKRELEYTAKATVEDLVRLLEKNDQEQLEEKG